MKLSAIPGKIKKHLFPVKRFGLRSWSQCGEDIILDHLLTHLGIKNPSYLDIGAHHPTYLSNTERLYRKGSTGINIEPNTALYKRFVRSRPKDINLNIGIGAEASVLDFYIMSVPTLCTFSKTEAESYKTLGFEIKSVEKVKVETIGDVVNKYCNGAFPHLLSLDVEGLDEEILRSINYKEKYPLIICVESISFSTFGSGIRQTGLINFLLSQGYIIYAETYVNTIFIMEKDWKEYAAMNSKKG